MRTKLELTILILTISVIQIFSQNWQEIGDGILVGEFELSRKSEYSESNWNESDNNESFYHLPNVIGVKKK